MPRRKYPIPEVGEQYRALILVLGLYGLRWGEVAALRVKRVDLLRRRLTVAESATEVSGRLVWGTPKSHPTRSVPIPRSLVDLAQRWCLFQGFPNVSSAVLEVQCLLRRESPRVAYPSRFTVIEYLLLAHLDPTWKALYSYI